MRAPRRYTRPAGALVIAAVAALAWWPRAHAGPVHAPEAGATAAPAPAFEPLAADATSPRDGADTGAFVELPDGRRLPALNGVENTAGLAWPASVSKTPVVGIKRGRAYDAYVHADGSQTSTIRVRNLRTGEVGTSAIVARPIGLGSRDPVRLELPVGSMHPLPAARGR